MSQLPERMLGAPTLLDHMERVDYKSSATIPLLAGVIATIGPSCRNEETIYQIIKAGLNMARLNFSHDSHEDHLLSLKLLKSAEKRYSKEKGYEYLVGVIGDLKGREIRTGTLLDQNSIDLSPGDSLKLITNHDYNHKCTKDIIYVDYEGLTREVKIGQKVFLDDTAICLEIKWINPEFLWCKVLIGGKLKNKVTVVVPEASFSLPVLSAKDYYDIQFCIANDVHYLMLSKIYTMEDVMLIRHAIGEKGKYIKIITKIENCRALRNFESIASVSDAILISRIDLAIELRVGKVYLAQKYLIRRCNDLGIPVIVGQQILMSMKDNPVAYRSDFFDIGSAIIDGADAIMLACVTSVGRFPVEAVKALSSATQESECAVWYPKFSKKGIAHSIGPGKIVAVAAVTTSFNVDAAAIVIITVSGQTALYTSNCRPKCPIIALTHSDIIARKVHLYRGVIPVRAQVPRFHDHEKNVEADVQFALTVAYQRGIVKNSDAVVLATPWTQSSAYANNVQIVFTYFDRNIVECLSEKRNHLAKRLA